MKTKVLIIGPIGNFGGRELEVGMIAKAFSNKFEVNIFSTSYMTKKSFALKINQNIPFTTLGSKILRSNFLYRVVSTLIWIKNGLENSVSFYYNSPFLKKLFNFKDLVESAMESKIKYTEVVFICAQLSSGSVNSIIELAVKHKKNILFRTTGAINESDLKNVESLKKVNLFIHHSDKNASKLYKLIKVPYKIVDQTAFNETSLLNLPLKSGFPVTFGFLGRFDKVKNIIPLVKAFQKTPYKLIISGKGPYKKELEQLVISDNNCELRNPYAIENISSFFKDIDVLVIPSINEAGPFVGVEAMAAGKLILSTDVGAMENRLKSIDYNWKIETVNDEVFIEQLHYINDLKKSESNKFENIQKKIREVYKMQYKNDEIYGEYNEVILNLEK